MDMIGLFASWSLPVPTLIFKMISNQKESKEEPSHHDGRAVARRSTFLLHPINRDNLHLTSPDFANLNRPVLT